MNRAVKSLFLLFIFLFLMAGCFGHRFPDRKTTYYTLEYDLPVFSGLKPLPYVIRVNRFQAASLYNTGKIVYRKNDFQRDTYNYHRWRTRPDDLVTDLLQRDLIQSDLFKAVFGFEAGSPSTHVLEGCVDEFLEYDRSDFFEARLSVSITLLKENEPDISKSILFQHKYHASKRCRQKTPQALAEAMSAALAEVSPTIITDIYNHLDKTNK